MMPVKSVFLKTYGKQKRKLSAWISTENRKEAFDSTFSSDGDISVFEPAKPLRIRERRTTAKCRPVRPAKKKATLHLKEKSCNEESIRSEENDIIPALADPQAAQTTRGKKKGVWRSRTVVPSKREATLSLTENSSEEENICPSSTLVSQGRKNTRKTQLVSVPEVLTRQRGQKIPLTSESDGDSKCHKKSVQMKRESNIHPPPSVGRFVTRRRRGAAAKPKLSKAVVHILNSSDDFAAGAFCPSNACQPSGRVRKKKRRKVLSAFLVSSAENSLNTVGTSSFATNPLREISLNESADHILGPCNRKPIFCSTPSAGSFSNRPSIKPFPINDKSTPSMSISCIGALSPFQKDLNSPGQCVGPLHSAPLTGLHSGEKLQSSLSEQEPDLHHHDEEPSGELFMEPEDTNRRSSCGKETKSHAEASETENGGTLPSLNLLSMDSESSSDFVSAAGGLAWLIEALKEKCLTERCTVQLERFDNLTVTQLCSQTTYSSCLGLLSSAHSNKTNEHLLSVDSNQTADMLPPSEVSLSVTNNKTRYDLQSVNSFESSQQAASVSDSLSSVNCKLSAECSSASALYDESSHHKESSVDLTAKNPVQQLFTEEEAVAVQDKYVTKKCALQFKKLSAQLHTGSRTPIEASLTCDDASVNTDQNKSENDNLRDLTCSGESTEGMCVMLSTDSSSPPVQAQSPDTETEEKTAVLTEILKEQCVSDKLAVKMKRLSLSQLKNILQLKGKKLKSPTVVSDSASDEQIKTDHQSESDANPCDENTSVKVNVKKRCSTVLSSEDKIASNKEEVVKRSRDSLPKRKKTSLAARERKRRSTSTDRPGTTRKACVSGLSVSRWKNKSNISTHMWAGGVRPVDCSINELIPTQHKPPMELGSTMNLSTPVRANQHNLSSLLAQFTPNTHTWSRLKAALSVHRKGMVFLTPRSHLSGSPVKTGLSDLSQDLFATPFRTPLPKHLRSQLKTPSLDVTEDEDLSDAEKVYAECGQERPLSWEECILPHRMKQCVKIGEGTFGEVFSTTNASGDTVALKIIPVEGSEKVNGEDQKTFGEILHEIIISKELSSLKVKTQNQTRGFIGLNDLHCARGCYPPDFLKAWDKFDQQKGSENDRPDFFEKDQLFIILEFEFGGIDLENSNGKLASLGVAKSILHQVTAALAVAEQELHFEHRDLHWGNVLVKTTKQKTGSFLLNGKETSLETKGVLVRIIDYSLSRLEIDELTVSCDISNDEELFMGQGDYQFDIYRLMRQENGNNWSDYRPHTNVLWLHYLCSKLMSMKYRGTGGRVAKDTREELTRFYNNVLHYGSAFEVLQNCPMFQ